MGSVVSDTKKLFGMQLVEKVVLGGRKVVERGLRRRGVDCTVG